MARATLALLLTAALYLGFTLLSSTDENLLLNAQVVVLQVGFGMALEQSYIFGPPIFLYLHVQGLFLLSILARKVQGFKDALDQELSGIPDSYRVRHEYWNWLSAFAFVQLFRRDGGFHFVPRSLMWISMEAIPLLLLFIVDLSFVRYQSWKITYSHHIVFILDLVFVIWYNSWGSKGTSDRSGNNPGRWLSSVLAAIWISIRLAIACIMTLLLCSQAHRPSFDIESVEKIALDIKKRGDEAMRQISMEEIFEAVMVQRRNRIWRLDDEGDISDEMKDLIMDEEDKWQSESFVDFLCKMTQWDILCKIVQRDETQRDGFRQAVWKAEDLWKAIQGKDVNMLDIGPCQWWGQVCRYLRAKDLWLVSTRPSDISISKADESGEGSSESIRWSSLNELSLADRSLRFSDFRYTRLQGANLEGVELQGANLEGAILWGANLARAKMNGTSLSAAQLQDAYFLKAELRSANLQRANLQRASLDGAQLWNVNLKKAELQRADFSNAELQGVNMESTDMDGASLWAATLTCTNLQGARLRGASFSRAKLLGTDLERAQLQGAKFLEAELFGTNLKKSQFERVDFYKAKIRSSFGMPEPLKLAWVHGVEIDTELPALFTDLAEEFARLVENQPDINIVLYKGENLKDCVRDTLTKFEKNKWLSREIGMISNRTSMDQLCQDVLVSEYWKIWAARTVASACENEFIGYRSVKRWGSENPLSEMEKFICPKNSSQEKQCSIRDRVKQCILGELYDAARDDQCPGIRAVPGGRWRISDSDWRKIWSEWREGAWKRKREEAWKDDD